MISSSICEYEIFCSVPSREQELLVMLEKHRRNDGQYDCIVPGSGGKDSAYTAHILKYKYKMNPLTVTWAPHLYTDIGWKNLNSFNDSGFDVILGMPQGDVKRGFTSPKKRYLFLIETNTRICPLFKLGGGGPLRYTTSVNP